MVSPPRLYEQYLLSLLDLLSAGWRQNARANLVFLVLKSILGQKLKLQGLRMARHV